MHNRQVKGLGVFHRALLVERHGDRGLRALEPLFPFAGDRLMRARELAVVFEQRHAGRLAEPQGLEGFLSQKGTGLGAEPGGEVGRHAGFDGRGRQPSRFRRLYVILPTLLGRIQPEQFGLPVFELLFLANLPDAVVGELLETGGALFFRQAEALGDFVNLLRDGPENVLATADGVMKHANPPQAAIVDVGIDRAGRHHVLDGDRFACLAIAVNPADTLLDTHGVPRQIVVDEEVAELEIETLAADL